MKRSALLILGIVLMVCVVAMAGCSKGAKKPVTSEPTAPAPRAVEPTPPPAQPERPVQPTVQPRNLEDVFFDYDKSALRPDAIEVLRGDGRILLDQPDLAIVIEGHCDERGTIEYNLALGDRRARAARDFLIDYGVNGARIETISYGEERPFAQGHDEAAWAQNRRAHFVPKQ